MREARLIETAETPVAAIENRDRLRPVSPGAVEALVASISELGRITDPIHVRRVRHRDNALVLIAGAHRLAAARALGRETVPAHVWDCSDDWARLLEIDDNLVNDDLEPLDRALFMAERKAVYVRLHPETRQGVSGAYNRWEKEQLTSMSFASTVADKLRVTERHVRRLIAAGEQLGPDEVRMLREAPQRPTLKDLADIAKLGNPAYRREAVRAFAHGEAKTIAAAMRVVGAAPAKKKPSADKIAAQLVRAFDAAPEAARRAFVEARGEELRWLLEEAGEG